MKKFKYRLKSYLKYLGGQRDEALKELKVAESIKVNLENRYQLMEAKMKRAFEINSQLGKTFSNIHDANDNNHFIRMLKKQMKDLSNEIVLAEEQYQEKYKKLLELQKQVRKIELHRESQENEYKSQMKKKEQKMFDEINNLKMGERNAKSI